MFPLVFFVRFIYIINRGDPFLVHTGLLLRPEPFAWTERADQSGQKVPGTKSSARKNSQGTRKKSKKRDSLLCTGAILKTIPLSFLLWNARCLANLLVRKLQKAIIKYKPEA